MQHLYSFVKLFFYLFIVIFSITCKTIKPIVESKTSYNLSNIYDSIKNNEISYKTLDIKFNIQYESVEQNMSLKGNLRILKDSIIWVSLSPGLGIEAARFMCNRDSLFILDRVKKNYTRGNYEYIKKTWKIDLDYSSLQSILTNRIFIYPLSNDEKSDFSKNFMLKNDSTNLEVYRKTVSNIENLIKISRPDFKITEYFISDITNLKTLSVKYTFDKLADGNPFIKTIVIKSLNKDKFINIELDYTKIGFNSDPNFSFKVPDNYSLIQY